MYSDQKAVTFFHRMSNGSIWFSCSRNNAWFCLANTGNREKKKTQQEFSHYRTKGMWWWILEVNHTKTTILHSAMWVTKVWIEIIRFGSVIRVCWFIYQKTYLLFWSWEKLRTGGEGGDRGWDGWKASPTQWTWLLANSGRWWNPVWPLPIYLDSRT